MSVFERYVHWQWKKKKTQLKENVFFFSLVFLQSHNAVHWKVSVCPLDGIMNLLKLIYHPDTNRVHRDLDLSDSCCWHKLSSVAFCGTASWHIQTLEYKMCFTFQLLSKLLPLSVHTSQRKNKIHNYELPIPFYILYSNLNPTQLPPKGGKTVLFPVDMWKLSEQITSYTIWLQQRTFRVWSLDEDECSCYVVSHEDAQRKGP